MIAKTHPSRETVVDSDSVDSGRVTVRFGDDERYPLPWVIRNKTEHERYLKILDDLVTRRRLSKVLSEYVEVVSTLVEQYEIQQEHASANSPSGVEMLRHLMESSGITQQQVGEIIGTGRSSVSRLLKGEFGIRAGHARKLGAFFGVSPELFLD